ncbi:MAG: hypothetical protein IJ809_02740 [Clostridia bacterium]|nr:hypothetical protein [Clostridia bacterium]
MRIYDIIEHKRDNKELSKAEIDFAIDGFLNGTVKDYQMSALLMAIYINGMTDEETYNLTMKMANSRKSFRFIIFKRKWGYNNRQALNRWCRR